MRGIRLILLLPFLFLLSRCVTEFYPKTNENQELLVVEGLITDQPEPYTIKLSKSLPLGETGYGKPLRGCFVTISDDLGNSYFFHEAEPGKYISDPALFRGVVGRKYSLHIDLNGQYGGSNHYESYPVGMEPVPPIDSLYYEKKIEEDYTSSLVAVGAQVYLDTHSPGNSCKYYRWEFTETWEFRLPFEVPNHTCWISANSLNINVKSTASITEDRINRFPLYYISNQTDRLKYKYSMLVKQYSLNQDEFDYWDKMKSISDQVGGLYDVTPSSIPSNIWCMDNPDEKVLGYFSVSALSTKRFFIKDNFSGVFNPYTKCIGDTIFNPGPIPNLGTFVWVIIEHQMPPPSYRVITYEKGCYDCSVRGTIQEPSYWNDYK